MKAHGLASVLVATDFSDGARCALKRAARLPLRPDARITLVHVIPNDIPGKLRSQAVGESGRALAQAAEDLHALGRASGNEGWLIGCETLEGSAAKQITKRARAVDADLVIVGRHGRRPIADFFVGSTAQKVLRLGEAPVLLARSAAEVPYQRVLVGLSLESGAAKVLRASRLLATNPAIQVFHASHVPFEEYVAIGGELALRYRNEYSEEASSRLDALVGKSRLEATISIKPGDPRQLLLDEVSAFGAQLLVLGTHGRKGLERMVLGSVAEWVLARVEVDTLIVRT
jgi:nucleotide-binding universal stress UspA family protein